MRYLGANSPSIRLRAYKPFLQLVLVLYYPFFRRLVLSSPVVTGAILQQSTLLEARPSLYSAVGGGTAFVRTLYYPSWCGWNCRYLIQQR